MAVKSGSLIVVAQASAIAARQILLALSQLHITFFLFCPILLATNLKPMDLKLDYDTIAFPHSSTNASGAVISICYLQLF